MSQICKGRGLGSVVTFSATANHLRSHQFSSLLVALNLKLTPVSSFFQYHTDPSYVYVVEGTAENSFADVACYPEYM